MPIPRMCNWNITDIEPRMTEANALIPQSIAKDTVAAAAEKSHGMAKRPSDALGSRAPFEAKTGGHFLVRRVNRRRQINAYIRPGKATAGPRTCTFVLDGDNVRHGLNRDLGYSPEAWTENIRRIAEVGKLMNEAGLIVIRAFISPYRQDREIARRIIVHKTFLEIHVNTSPQACERRDIKGMYKHAKGKSSVCGVATPNEALLHPALALDTASVTVDICVDTLLEILLPKRWVDAVN